MTRPLLKKPVRLPDDDTFYYPENGKVVIKDQIEVVEDVDEQIINLTTASDETP